MKVSWWMPRCGKTHFLPSSQLHLDTLDPSLPSPVLETNLTISDSHSHGNFTLEQQTDQEALDEHYFNLGIYGAIVGALCVTSMIRTVYFFVLCMKSSVSLHDKMFESIIRAPCRFFDTNPVGK